MGKEVCNDYRCPKCQKKRHVRLSDRKKEYIKEFQKAKDKGIILGVDKIIDKTH